MTSNDGGRRALPDGLLVDVETVGARERLHRMERRDAVLLLNAQGRQGTIGNDELRLGGVYGAHELLRVLASHLVVLRLHPPRSVDGRTLLQDLDLRIGQEAENPRSGSADLLRAKVARGDPPMTNRP